MFVSVRFTVKRLPDCSSLELITVTLHCNNHKSCLLFYRPPCVSVDVLGVLQNYYELIFHSSLVLESLVTLTLIYWIHLTLTSIATVIFIFFWFNSGCGSTHSHCPWKLSLIN